MFKLLYERHLSAVMVGPLIPPTTRPADPIVDLPRVGGSVGVNLGGKWNRLHGIKPTVTRDSDRSSHRRLSLCCDGSSLREGSANTGEVMAFVTFRTLFVISFTVLFLAGGAAISRMLTTTMFASSER